jgi:hypothetical protein
MDGQIMMMVGKQHFKILNTRLSEGTHKGNSLFLSRMFIVLIFNISKYMFSAKDPKVLLFEYNNIQFSQLIYAFWFL